MEPTIEKHVPSSFRDEGSESQYRPLNGLALAGLMGALASPLAFLHPVLWIIPVSAVVLSVTSLRSMARSYPAQAGRTLALIALAISVAVAVAVPARLLTRQALFQVQSRRFGEEWFEFLRRGEPQKAHQYTVVPETRAKLDDTVWEVYRADESQKTALQRFVKFPPVSTLLSLRDKATVRYYCTELRDNTVASASIVNVYAVTFPHDGVKKTFFVYLKMLRTEGQKDHGTGWQIIEHRGPYHPQGWVGP